MIRPLRSRLVSLQPLSGVLRFASPLCAGLPPQALALEHPQASRVGGRLDCGPAPLPLLRARACSEAPLVGTHPSVRRLASCIPPSSCFALQLLCSTVHS